MVHAAQMVMAANTNRSTKSGKPTIDPQNHEENVGQRSASENSGAKPTISPENHEANVGQRVTRDDGDNDDKGELK